LYHVVVVPGDGIGPEVTAAALQVVAEGACVTPDLGGAATTMQMAQACANRIR
jgi:isocitrate/isopropylmalate dehydrogenase